MATVIDGVYHLGDRVGKGGMATVYKAEVDFSCFDYTTLYAYTQVHADNHTERRRKAEELATQLCDKELDLATIRTILEAKNIPTPGKTVAVKIATGEGHVERFEGEWKNLLCLSHPNVVQVYGGGDYDGRPYYAMQLLRGIIDPSGIKHAFTIREKLNVIVQAGRGLQYLHDNGLVHRDIKPDNLITCEDEPGVHVTRVADLGLAKNLHEDLGLTVSHAIMGSPYYMSPEQMAKSGDVDFKADIYSLGASLYELATGVKPYNDKTSMFEIMTAVGSGEVPLAPEVHVPDFPPPVSGIIECAMARHAEDRYASAADMVADIELYLREECEDLTESISFDAANRPLSKAKVGKRRYRFEAITPKTKATALQTGIRPDNATQTGARFTNIVPMPGNRGQGVNIKGLVIGAFLALIVAGGMVAAIMMSSNTKPKVPEDPKLPPKPEDPHTEFQPRPTELQTALKAALKAANPEYRGKGKFIEEDGRFVSIDLSSCGVSDLSPLRALKLRELRVTENKIRDLSPLRGMPLQTLAISVNDISDLKPLEGMPLKRLYVDNNSAKDLRPLAKLPLEVLTFSPQVVTQGIGELQRMSSLKQLGRWAGDARPVAEFWKAYVAGDYGLPVGPAPIVGQLHQLLASTNPAYRSDKAQIAEKLGKIIDVKLIDAGVTDLRALKGLPLETLHIANCPVTDLRPLAGMPLKYLNIANTKVTDLSVLQKLPLKELRMEGCPATDASIPAGIPTLQHLSISMDKIKKGIPELRSSKSLRTIGGRWDQRLPVAVFWKKYDLLRAASVKPKPKPKPELTPVPDALDKGCLIALSMNNKDLYKAGDHIYVRNRNLSRQDGRTMMSASAYGKHDGARSFAHESHGVWFPPRLGVDIRREITVCAWLKAGKQELDEWPTILQKYNRKARKGFILGIIGEDSGKVKPGHIHFSLFGPLPNGVSVVSKAPLTDNKWHFICGTYDGTTTRLYVDGVLQSEHKSDQSVVIQIAKGPLAVGAGEDGKCLLQGELDEVAIWSRAFSAKDVKGLYDHSNAGKSYCELTAPAKRE